MSTPAESRSRGTTRSIGQVLATLKAEFPDISISKIRFLEAEGLIAPERAPSGYRRYAETDVERLRYVLAGPARPLPAAEGDPRAPGADGPRAAAADRGPSLRSRIRRRRLRPARPRRPTARPAARLPPKPPLRLSRHDLLEASGLTESALAELERTQIVHAQAGHAPTTAATP